MNRDRFRLAEAQFARIKPHLLTDARGKPHVDDRRVISGIVHVLKLGGRWIDAAPDYGPRKTLYNRYVRWAAKGVWAEENGTMPNIPPKALPRPQRDRTDVLPPQGLQARRNPIRSSRRQLPGHSLHRSHRQLLVMRPSSKFRPVRNKAALCFGSAGNCCQGVHLPPALPQRTSWASYSCNCLSRLRAVMQ